MRSLRRLTGFAELLLLAVILVGWGGSSDIIRFDGGGGGGFTGGFTGRAPITVQMTADKTTLPVNILNAGPSIGSPYTNTVTVQVMQNGKLFAAPAINVAIASGLSSGALYYLDGDPAHEQCPAGATCPPTAPAPIAFRNIAFKDTAGIVTFHVNATNIPGTVMLVASAQDPQTGQVISTNLAINVTGGGGAAGGFPSVVQFVMDPALVYIRNNPLGTTTVTQNTVKQFQVFVLDDFGQPINQGAGHALRVELLPNRPNGGEWLSTVDASGNLQEGASVLASLIGGVATLALHSGTLPGTVVISATADRRDNNVDNGIETGITNYAMVSIGTGEIKSLTFTGPFADAVFVGANNLIAVNGLCPNQQPCDSVWSGVYNRIISVVASDPFGNPPPEGTPITFRLIDSPLDMLVNRYPDQGHGQFAITGYNGDPQEGSWEFFAPNRKVSRAVGDTLNPFVVPNGVSYAVADPLCLLMLQDPEIINPNPSTINALPAEGRLEYHVGSRVITGRIGNMLTVNTPFNQVSQNVGANVWYTVGCPPYKGNVMNIGNGIVGNEVIILTDVSGRASTVMSYPASQVGRRFMVAAESNGGKVGAVMTHWYLGNPDGSVLTITQPPQLAQQVASAAPIGQNPWPALIIVTQEVAVGSALSLPVTLQLLDGGVTSGGVLVRTPIPGVPIAVEIIINDPSEAAAIAAEEAVVKAQAALDAFDALNPGVCDLIVDPETGDLVERDPAKCAERKALAATLEAAQIAAAQARAIANLHTPTASVVPATLASGAGGYANLVLQVNDLPADGSVDFFFSTVGPEIRSETLQITVKPPQPQ